MTSGTTAKLSCSNSTTWVRISRRAVSLSPYRIVTAAAGMMAMLRVISRRTQGGMHSCGKPSLTACPARVAVTVEFSPQHSKAMANSVGAMA